LALTALFVARFFHDLTDGFRWRKKTPEEEPGANRQTPRSQALRWAMLAWLIVTFAIPLAETVLETLSPGFNAPKAMAAYLDQNVPQDALIESWEPEMGFLTDHNYHFPPAMMLPVAVAQVHLGGPPVADAYHFVETESPEYVLLGEFSQTVEVYPADLLARQYSLVTRIGSYELYEINKQ
jgi:hypothetical protein